MITITTSKKPSVINTRHWTPMRIGLEAMSVWFQVPSAQTFVLHQIVVWPGIGRAFTSMWPIITNGYNQNNYERLHNS